MTPQTATSGSDRMANARAARAAKLAAKKADAATTVSTEAGAETSARPSASNDAASIEAVAAQAPTLQVPAPEPSVVPVQTFTAEEVAAIVERARQEAASQTEAAKPAPFRAEVAAAQRTIEHHHARQAAAVRAQNVAARIAAEGLCRVRILPMGDGKVSTGFFEEDGVGQLHFRKGDTPDFARSIAQALEARGYAEIIEG